MTLKQISVDAEDYIAKHGAIPNSKDKGIWVFKVGLAQYSFYKSSYHNQMTLAKQEAQKINCPSITLLEKVM